MRNITRLLCLLAAAAPLTGCMETIGSGGQWMDTADQSVVPPATYLSTGAVQADVEGQGETAVENALIWSEKFADAVVDLGKMQQENHQLAEKSRKQSDHIITLQQEIKQYQKELAESNTMLLEMKDELGNWKTNVLGFRDEIRQAQEAQLAALRRVLKLLGGDLDEQDDQLAASPGRSSGSYK